MNPEEEEVFITRVWFEANDEPTPEFTKAQDIWMLAVKAEGEASVVSANASEVARMANEAMNNIAVKIYHDRKKAQ